ncbi:Protein-glutamate methylesterase/protein-glutamine glutaminase [Dyadobacter sp. CECT 9623]|uniref:Protein-glutamate methylesterase/protein-glutamine glutaminase n=1 Tax=Dyadobacter linearis TaxID=2823330 RepID=A0ABM8UW82_9BACT|nr:response regulator [Dyadobacter sp. CECT 9623]CAG5072976.1 Protein-glutamate methylesterase/protein-glutamine glutaminase [Dyadobacter sp. CECT 9623]
MNSNTTRKISCLIIDDEEPAHEVLKFLIAKIPWLVCVGSCYNAVEALEVIPDSKPDILFLDVNMPELTGLDLLSIVKAPNSHVIMTTAYSQYAVDGFTFDVTAFLLKPIGFDRFLKAVTKVRGLVTGNNLPDEKTLATAAEEMSGSQPVQTDQALAARPMLQPINDWRDENAVQEEYMWIWAEKNRMGGR